MSCKTLENLLLFEGQCSRDFAEVQLISTVADIEVYAQDPEGYKCSWDKKYLYKYYPTL